MLEEIEIVKYFIDHTFNHQMTIMIINPVQLLNRHSAIPHQSLIIVWILKLYHSENHMSHLSYMMLQKYLASHDQLNASIFCLFFDYLIFYFFRFDGISGHTIRIT